MGRDCGVRGAADSRGWGDYPAPGGADRRAGGGLLTDLEEPARAAAPAAEEHVPEAVSEPVARGWVPSAEKVVWDWPVLEDRLVEDFE